jgi:hypothetical protein
MTRRRYRMISTSTLRATLRALEGWVGLLPGATQQRIAIRSELWLRELEEDELVDGWLLSTLPGVH